MLLTCLCLFLVVCAPGVFATALNRRHFVETLPLSVFSIGLVLYLFGLFDALRAGAYAVLLLGALLYGGALYVVLRGRRLKAFCKALLSPAFLLFALSYGVLVFGVYGKQACRIDEFTHWMDIVKAMTQVDAFGLDPAAHSAYGGYLPGMAVLQYFAQVVLQTVGGGVFEEWLAYLMYGVAVLCLFFPFAKGLGWRPSVQHLLFLLAAFGVPAVFFEEYAYTTVYIDPYVGLAAGFCIAYPLLGMARGGLGIATLYTGLAALVLSKDIGALFALAAVLVYAAACFAGEGGWSRLRKAGVSLGAAAVLLLTRWSWILKKGGQLWEAGSSFSLYRVVGVLTQSHPEDDYRRDIITRYFDSLFHPEFPLGGGNTSLLISYGLALALLVIGVFIAAKREKPRAKGLAVAIGCLITAVVYVLGMCYMYMFIFSYGEGRQLLQMNRYMGILCLMLLSVLTFRLLDRLPAQPAAPWMSVLLVGLCLLVPHNALYSLVSRQNVQDSYAMRWTYNAYADDIKSVVDSGDATVYAVCRDHFDNWFMRLCVRPLHMEQTGDPRDFTYVWLCHPPASFPAEYGSLFETETDIGEHRLYRWTQEGKLRLVPLP